MCFHLLDALVCVSRSRAFLGNTLDEVRLGNSRVFPYVIVDGDFGRTAGALNVMFLNKIVADFVTDTLDLTAGSADIL